MYNKKLHILLYSLLFIYIIVSLTQYFHFKNLINRKIKRIDDLNTMISINDTKINQIKSVRESYQTLELYLDSTLIKTNNTLKKSIHKSSINTKTLKKEKLVEETKVDSSLIKRNIKVSDSIARYANTLETDTINPTIKKDTIKKQRKLSTEEYRNQAEAIKPYFFNEITRVYHNIKKPRNVRKNDNHIWIEINSENGNYKNSLKNIIHNITINNVSVEGVN